MGLDVNQTCYNQCVFFWTAVRKKDGQIYDKQIQPC